MTKEFPHHYEVALKRTQGPEATLTAGARPALAGGPPPEFGGKDAPWSPEHLLLASANLCLMTTFVAVAERSRLTVLDYASDASGTLDKTPEGLVFTEISLRVSIKVAPEDREKAERLVQMAKKHCIVSNSLKRPIDVTASVSAG